MFVAVAAMVCACKGVNNYSYKLLNPSVTPAMILQVYLTVLNSHLLPDSRVYTSLPLNNLLNLLLLVFSSFFN